MNKARLTVAVELTCRVPDVFGECTDPDFKDAYVEVHGNPGNWKAVRAVWKWSGEPVEKFLLGGTNNLIAINDAANKAFNKRTVEAVCRT